MWKQFETYMSTLITLGATLVLDILANSVVHLTNNEEFLLIAIGVMASLVVFTIENRVPYVFKSLLNERLEELTQGLELYRLVTSIDDKDLQKEVVRLARSLSNGEIPASQTELRVRGLIKKIEISLWASDYHPNIKSLLKFWESGTAQTWYAENLDAVKRGVQIERHFLLHHDEAIKTDGTWDPKVVALLQKHANDNIQVYILWVEEVATAIKKPSKDILRDFVIFDEKEATASTEYETKGYRHPSDRVQDLIEIFQEQRLFSHKLEEFPPLLT